MKKEIHPTIYATKVTCACGATMDTTSTVENISIDVCSTCHPFYTGTQNLVDTSGRIDMFKNRTGLVDKTALETKAKKKEVRKTRKSNTTGVDFSSIDQLS